MLKVMIIDNDLKHIKPLKASLTDSGFDVVAHIQYGIALRETCCKVEPDIVIIDVDTPTTEILENVRMLLIDCAKPILMFTHDSDNKMIKEATKAGVNAYIVGDIPNERLRPIVDAAIARFEETELLRKELSNISTKLEDRKIVEKAKGILMKHRNLDENEAYVMMRDMAMKSNSKIAEIAKKLVDASSLLTI